MFAILAWLEVVPGEVRGWLTQAPCTHAFLESMLSMLAQTLSDSRNLENDSRRF